MINMVVSLLLSFPKGAMWNLRNTGPPGKKHHEIWMAVVRVMVEFAGLGRDWSLSDVIVCWNYTMNNPSRGMAYARLYTKIGNPVQEASAVARPVAGGSRANSKPLTQTKVQAADIEAWNQQVTREEIIANYYVHLVSNLYNVFWAVFNESFCEPSTEVSAPVLTFKSCKIAWITNLSRICYWTRASRACLWCLLIFPSICCILIQVGCP
jgi:hypothetical protein